MTYLASERLSIRVAPHELVMFKTAAELCGETFSEYIRRVLTSDAKAVIETDIESTKLASRTKDDLIQDLLHLRRHLAEIRRLVGA